MSIKSQIEALTISRDIIRSKMVSAKQASSSDKLSALASKLSILDTSDGTATASDILAPKVAYVNGSKVTGTLSFATDEQIRTAINAVR